LQIPKNAEDQCMSASIVKRLTAVAALVAVMVVLLTLSRGTYARNDFNPASADVGDAHTLEFH
jgi:hypothetical protein